MIVLSGEEGRAGTGSPAVHGTDRLAPGLLQPNGREDAGGTGHRSSPSDGYVLSTHKGRQLVSGQGLALPQVGECGWPYAPPPPTV